MKEEVGPNFKHIALIAASLMAMATAAKADGVSLDDFCCGIANGMKVLLDTSLGEKDRHHADVLRVAMQMQMSGDVVGELDVCHGNNKRLH